ncbi:MAG: hypothetical protein L0206_25140 [Actinobacteria bacterium]|nr:hypothetical protein [Actinomycetota bacterium]
MRPTTYSLQFRGFATERDGGMTKHGRAPGCALVTSLSDGLEGHFVWAPDDSEAIFESTLVYVDGARFEESAAIRFAHGNTLRLHGLGQLEPSPDPDLRQGTVVWNVFGGDGRFDGVRGRVASNFLLSGTGDLTETHLGVIFMSARKELRAPDQGLPRRERGGVRETIDAWPGEAGPD